MMLKKGVVMRLNDKQIEVKDFIGGGGQGEVYKVEIDGVEYALKWYFPKIATEALKHSISNLVECGAPNDKFLWPQLVVDSDMGFGYVMDLRPKGYFGLNDWMMRKFDMDLYHLAKACYMLADSFHLLHARGLSYQDISLGNVFVRPLDGEILICDNDNVTASGEAIGGVIGTPKFMAPEIVLGKALPSTNTDMYSLAVLLFHLLTISHPLDGAEEVKIKCLDLPASAKLYGSNATFIFDPVKTNNRPVEGIHNSAIKLWKIYPKSLQEKFIKTFTVGITEPNNRTRESEWRKAFGELMDGIYKCSNCGAETIYDVEYLRAYRHNKPCFVCGKIPILPPRIKIGDSVVTLGGGRVEKRHISRSNSLDLVMSSSCVRGKYIITNKSKTIFTCVIADKRRTLKPGESMETCDMTIDFGEVTGEVRV